MLTHLPTINTYLMLSFNSIWICFTSHLRIKLNVAAGGLSNIVTDKWDKAKNMANPPCETTKPNL